MLFQNNAENPLPSSLPYRQLTRLVTEFHLSGNEQLRHDFPDSYPKGLVFQLILRLCLDDWVDPDRIARATSVSDIICPPAEPRRGATVNAVAASLGASFETIRRYAHAMTGAGVLALRDGRLTLATTPANAERVTTYFTVIHDAFVRLIEDIGASCDAVLPVAVPGRVPVASVLARALDASLMPLDANYMLHSNWVTLLLFATISNFNTRHIAYDPVLARRYGHLQTPDALRRPVSLRSIARLLHISYATAWRHALLIEERELVTRRSDGWVVLSHNLNIASTAAVVKRNADYMVRKITELVAMGLDPARAGDHYLVARPPLVSLLPG